MLELAMVNWVIEVRMQRLVRFFYRSREIWLSDRPEN
jgi:hypothetical protein